MSPLPGRRHEPAASEEEDGADARDDEAPGISRSLSAATERIQEIIDAAEQVAEEIRADAQREAASYLAEQRRAADRLTEERAAEISNLTSALAEHAEGVLQRTEALIHDLEEVRARVLETRSTPDVRSMAGFAESQAEATSEEALTVARGERIARDEGVPIASTLAGVADILRGRIQEPAIAKAEEAPEPESDDRPEFSTAPEAGPPSPGQLEESAMLRATQMAVAGSTRDEVARALESEFGIEHPAPILDEILGPVQTG